MNTTGKDDDSREKDRLKQLMKAATGFEDISEASKRSSVEIRRDSKALNSAKEFLEDMEEDGVELASAHDTEIVVPNQKDDMKLNSVFIGGPEPKPPTRRKVLHSQLAESVGMAQSLSSSLRQKKTGVDQSFNLMDPRQARKPSPTRGTTTGLSSRIFGATRFDKFNDASPMKESEEYIPKRSRIRRLQHNIACLLLFIALLITATVLTTKLTSKDATPQPLDTTETAPNKPKEPFTFGHQDSEDALEETDPERFDLISAKLVKSGVADQFTISTEGTAQFKALDWLSNHDPAQLDISSDYLVSRYVLAVLFYATSGRDPASTSPMNTDWTTHDMWMTGEGYCTWHGVKCVGEDGYFLTEGNGKVFQVSLASNNLRGSIPSELLSLSDLFLLNLKSNWLEGSLPHPFQFRNMRDLLLDDNMLNGTIGIKMVSMVELRTLSMSYNEFTGSIPESLGAATQLHYVKLNGNLLTGTIPSSLSSLTKLETFQVSHNQLNGTLPEEFYEMKRLVNVSMSENDISGTLSPNLGQLSHLAELHLTGNDISGTIPEAFENMALLGVLQLGDNNLSGGIPLSLGRRHRLERLDLTENDLFGSMPQEICDLLDMGRLEHLAADCLIGETTVVDLNNFDGGRRSLQRKLQTAPMTSMSSGQYEDEEGNIVMASMTKQLRMDADPENQPVRAQSLSEVKYTDTGKLTDESLAVDEETGVTCRCCTFCHVDEATAARIFDLKEEEASFDAEDCQSRLEVSNFHENEWPGLVGMDGEEAKLCLESNYPSLTVTFVQVDEQIPRSSNLNRVIMYLDEDGLVNVPPSVGRRQLLRKKDRN